MCQWICSFLNWSTANEGEKFCRASANVARSIYTQNIRNIIWTQFREEFLRASLAKRHCCILPFFPFSFQSNCLKPQQGSLRMVLKADEMGKAINLNFCLVSHQGYDLVLVTA